MTVAYDNWERLVTATLRREQLRLSAFRTPSDVSSASSSAPPSPINCDSPSAKVKVLSFKISSSLLVPGKSFTSHQILQATDYFSKSNFIKHGRSGDLFHGVLEGGLPVVVKRVNLSASSYLITELEFLGKVSHARFVPLLGHCLEDGNDKFLVYKYMPNKDLSRFLCYKGVFSDDSNDDYRKPESLDWVTRLKIATGVAQGLFYLHHECDPPFVHRNIEARSILIDENFEARIGRFTEVCNEKKGRNQNRISRLLRLSKTSEGDTSGASNATCAYDIYCFGKVLLDLVTGNPRFGDRNGSNIKGCMENVLAYITTYDKELLVNIVDPSLVVDEHLLVEVWAVSVVAKACLSPKPSERPQMLHIIEALKHPLSARFSNCLSPWFDGQISIVDSALAKTRVSKGPSSVARFHTTMGLASVPRSVRFSNCLRPWSGGQISILNPTLAKTRVSKGLSSAGTSQVDGNTTLSDNSFAMWNRLNSAASGIEEAYPNRDILDLPNLRIYSMSELKAATRNFKSDRVLGQGGFGIVYKGQLHKKFRSNSASQSLVAIKKLDAKSMQGFVEWKTEICVLGSLSHPNIIKLLGYCWKGKKMLLGYCWKGKKMLLVYEYMQKGSLDSHLFGRCASIQPLQWDVRLKILIGAARALSFLHALKKPVIYRDFKCSNVLLDVSYKAKLSDFGLATMGPLDSQSYITTEVMGTYGYADPEYVATGRLSVKSDVYNFGVVLAEVLSGLRAMDNNRPQGKHTLVDWIKPYLSGQRKLKIIMDSRLGGKYPAKATVEVAQLALRCLASEPDARPSMKEVVFALENIVSSDENPIEAGTISTQQTANLTRE